MNIHLWSEDEYQAIKGQVDRIASEQFQAIKAQLDRIETNNSAILNGISGAIATLQTTETKIMSEIDDMIAEITEVKGIQDSGVATINRMADQLNQMVQNATDLNSLKQQVAQQTQALKENAQPLADAIQANSPPSG